MKVGGIRYEARSRGRASPDTLDFWHQTIEPTTAWTPDDRADYCLGTRRWTAVSSPSVCNGVVFILSLRSMISTTDVNLPISILSAGKTGNLYASGHS